MSGIKNIKQISKTYKEAEIYFHQDLDGIFSFLAMKKYLEDNGIKVMDCHIIQYGSLEFNVKNIKPGRLPVIVDFAHVKDIFVIATDHHDNQTGANDKMSTNFKKSRSNAETISDEIANGVFTMCDIDLVKTIDSADFVKFNIKPEHIQRSIFKLNREIDSHVNRFSMGLTVNRLLLALKNKRIKITSLDGQREHSNRNLTECLALDSNPSLYSLYLNIQHYIKNATSYEWNLDLKTYHDARKLPTPEQLNFNLHSYIETRKQYLNEDGSIIKNREIDYDPLFKIVKQHDIGETYKTGSYDRYVVFRNFPEADWVCTTYKMGLIQIACNPFKEKSSNINLGDLTRELFEKYKTVFSEFRISLEAVKRINENETYKLKQKYRDYNPMGFKFNDLITFYKDCIYYLPNRRDGDMKTIDKLNLEDDKCEEVITIKEIFNKLYSEWTFEERHEMSFYKIPGLNIMETLSGGHPSITNIQGLNYLDERRDAIGKYFGGIIIPSNNNINGNLIYKYISNYQDLMLFLSDEYLSILKEKLMGKSTEYVDSDIVLLGDISESTG
jgi:hypothetical protein